MMIRFSQIKPFIRYAHYLHLNTASDYQCSIPCDARFFYVLEGCGEISIWNSSCRTSNPLRNVTDHSTDNPTDNPLDDPRKGRNLPSERKKYFLQKGDGLLINSGIPYQLHAPKDRVTYLALNFDYTFSRADHAVPVPPMPPKLFSSSCLLEHVLFEDLPALNEHYPVRQLHKANNILCKIREEYTRRLLYHEMKESQLFTQILIEIARTINASSAPAEKEIVPRILDCIQERFKEPLTNQKLGELFDFHPNYINALIKSATGMSLHSYLIHVRLSNAAGFLENSTLSIGEIAECCGFYDIYHFSRCFKQKMGLTPSQYRKLQA